MKERPILFSAPMVRAIRANIKTQTRRVVNRWHFSEGNEGLNLSFSGLVPSEISPGFWRLSSRGEGACWIERAAAICPHGKPGDGLWVKETFNIGWLDGGKVLYRADGGSAKKAGYPAEPKWKPSIFMPRSASRELLDITNIGMERLLSISHDDAIAEGLTRLSKDGGKTFKYGIPDRDGYPGTDDDGWAWSDWDVDPRKAYFRLWEKINGAGSSQANPWVWAEGFRRVEVR